MTETKDGTVVYEVSFVAPVEIGGERPVRYPDGTVVVRNARITAPPQWAGQVRDITIPPDGGIRLGPDKSIHTPYGRGEVVAKPPPTPDGGICAMCGELTVRTGTCRTCISCGFNDGCG